MKELIPLNGASPLEFIASITQHIPEPSFQLVRYYGWYSNRMRGDRKKQKERNEKGEDVVASDQGVIDIRNYKPKRIPQLMWRECIKKIWEVDPLTCPKCTGEMKIISFIYQRKFISDPDNTVTVSNILGEIKTYVFGKTDEEGNYFSEPDYAKMPEGTTMLKLARTVHKPTRKSCLRCHAKAGGGDWTKRGDMGLSSINPAFEEDVHMSPEGANLSCAACHAISAHKVGGRGIDLRQTEGETPTCNDCHTITPHSNSIVNRHAQNRVSCQVCHIREMMVVGRSRPFNNTIGLKGNELGQKRPSL